MSRNRFLLRAEASGDLVIECLGVHVRVATKFVKMMKRKKVARNESSNSDSSIQISLAILRRTVFASFSRSSEKRILSSSLRSGSENLYLCSLVLLDDLVYTRQRDSTFASVPLLPSGSVRDVDRREVVQVSAICFGSSMG